MEPAKPATNTSCSGSQRILVVDDDPQIRESLRKVLRAEGHEVALAADGREAVETFNREQIDLVLLDLSLPVNSGWDTFGIYEYLLVADGKWLPDPSTDKTVPNPFGGRNSVLTVSISPKIKDAKTVNEPAGPYEVATLARDARLLMTIENVPKEKLAEARKRLAAAMASGEVILWPGKNEISGK